MSTRRFSSLALWVGTAFLFPATSFAAITDDVCTGIDCNLCNFGQLIQNIINFAIGVSIPVAIVMFAWAGILFFTSGGNQVNITKAKNIFRTVFIGFLFALSGWLIVQTVLSVLVKQTFYIGNHWNSLQCESAGTRLIDTKVCDIFGTCPGGQVTPQGPASANTTVPTSGNLVGITAFSCKNPQSCQISATTNVKLEAMRTTLGDQASQYQITETGVNTSVIHASGADNLDMSCFGLCSGTQVYAAIQAWPGTVKYETNSQSDYNQKLDAGVSAGNMLLITGTFDSAGNCTAGTGNCITAPHMSLNP